MFSPGTQVSVRDNDISTMRYSLFVFWSKAISSFSEHVPNDVYALNTHGLLLERLGLYNTAVKQFVNALKLSQDEERDMISLNLTRVLIQIGKHEEAIELCRQVKCGSFNSQCHLALSLFKGKSFMQIYIQI